MVKRSSWVPQRGDLVWISLNPQAGHEQAGHRPMLVMSPKAYNGTVGLMLACPVTRQAKGYPFEVALPEGSPVQGVILSDHVRSLDWKVRKAEFICAMPEETVSETGEKLGTLLPTAR
jgi:mRNA interferase MazF